MEIRQNIPISKKGKENIVNFPATVYGSKTSFLIPPAEYKARGTLKKASKVSKPHMR